MRGHRKTGNRWKENGKVAELAESSNGEGKPEEWRDGGRVKVKMENLSVIPSKLNAQDLFGACPSNFRNSHDN